MGNTEMTPRQRWYLHKLTGEDTREWKLTKESASQKISELLEAKGNKKASTVKSKPASKLTKVKATIKSSITLDGEQEAYKFLGRAMAESDGHPVHAIKGEMDRVDTELQARKAPFRAGTKSILAKGDGWTMEALDSYAMALCRALNNLTTPVEALPAYEGVTYSNKQEMTRL